MKVGCIGLGDIAQKAYLPVLTAQPGLELHLHTRTPATLDGSATPTGCPRPAPHRPRLAARPGPRRRLRARPDRRARRDRHPADRGGRARRTSTSRSPTTSPTPQRLVRLAEERGVGLAVGFNRRYAPALRAVPGAPARADPAAEEPRRPARGPAHPGPRRLHPRRRHPALPGPRRPSSTSTCAPGSATGCCTMSCSSCPATVSPPSA